MSWIEKIYKSFKKGSEKKESKTKSSTLNISSPLRIKHELHINFDKECNEFIGLPNEWKHLLEQNNIE